MTGHGSEPRTPLDRRSGSRRRRRQLALAAAALATLVALPAGPASADPDLTSARHRAAALRVQVDRLQVQAELATERYDAVQDELASLTTREGLARRQLDQARAARDTTLSSVEERARAIYMSGGTAGLFATVLDGQDIGDVLNRYEAVRVVMESDGAEQQRAQAVADQAAGIALQIGRLADRQSALEAQAQQAADEVDRLLRESQTLLADADATVRRLVDQQRASAEAAAAAASRARFAGLGLLTVVTDVPGNPRAAAAIAAARTRLGLPYVWGAVGPATFDCSGLTGWAYRQAGLSLPRTAAQQWYAGPHVALSDLAPGDLLFWAVDVTNPATIHHVAMYVGSGRMIEAPRTGLTVRETAVPLDGLIGAVRPGA